ncbi:MAG: polysaccharide deacetylase [Candidatus Berkelbacteria bacterium]|nr:polysaccharide deacetylase [Candidatus Berkelbacteria bacterium]
MKSKYIIFSLTLVILVAISLLIINYFKTNNISASTILAPLQASTTAYPKVEKFDVPVLMYHYIRNAEGEDQLGKNLSVSPANFAAHLKGLKDDNYQTIKLQDLADISRSEISKVYFEKKKPLIITFDDGYDDAYTVAFPTLKKYGFIGTFFIIKDYIGRDGRLSQGQIDTMTNAGMEFGAHTLSHPDLTKINIDEVKNQIVNSKGEWSVFCYPAGKYNQDVINFIKEAGYLTAVTTKIGIANENSDLFQLRRVRVENVSPQTLMDKISFAYEHGN